MSTITTNINEAITQLKAGNLVAIPTETVYGLAGNAENEEAIRKIFALKNRPLNHPLIMHVAKDWDLSRWVTDIPNYAQELIDNFWPGPLTLVLKCNLKTVNPLVTGGQDTVAIRCPSHSIAQSLLTALNFPLVAPSANPFGKISPTTANHVQQSFREQPLLILDGGRCEVGIESTIVAATDPNHYQLLRHGVIDEAAIQATIAIAALKEASSIQVPGKLLTHYQPDKPLYCFTTTNELQTLLQAHPKAYVFSFTKQTYSDQNLCYQFPQNPKQVAFELYYQLRHADMSSATTILVELPPKEESWYGVRERLLKMISQPN
ncbi:translation initiation protein [Legionella beliardensis]|uniref:Threonylcarbamoyl-AMP synthase n=1 Tax=Legionella beliardensis TaxID=91822 RepID=A0A378HZY1_9GAMM|nr:L-threonylcarbamoyladenylate synthase [Legionella beliardensis]STX28020.1 translation initiation protein [Legionella beliardensis]